MQWFLVCSKIMKVSPLPNSRTFSSPQIETLYLLAVTPHSHVPSMDFPIRGISYAWNHVIFALLCLMQRWHNGFRFHPSCNMYHSPISFLGLNNIPVGLPWWLSGKRIYLQCRRPGFDSWVGKIPWEKKLQPTPVFLPGKSHGQRSLVGFSPRGYKRVRHDSATKEHYSIVWTYHILLYNASVDDHLGCFYFLVFVNDIAVNTHIQVCAWTCIHFSRLHIQEWSSWVLLFLFLPARNILMLQPRHIMGV